MRILLRCSEFAHAKKELIFAAVCDGIGGLRAGECASGLVAEQLTEWFYREGF